MIEMPHYIVKLGGKYLEWSTVVDAPVTFGLDRVAFARAYRTTYGTDAFEQQFHERMARAEATGTSARGLTLADVIASNRAGLGETHLTEDQLIRAYVTHINEELPRGSEP